MFVNQMRLPLVFQEDGKGVETFDGPAQLKSVHQIDRNGGSAASAFCEKAVLKTAGHVLVAVYDQLSFSLAAASASAGDTHVMPGSARNHERWRRA
jgi:hypothetical protein